MAGITRSLAAFVSGLTVDAVPSAAYQIVADGFVDTVGVMLAGAQEDVVDVLLRTIGDRGAGNSGARVCLSGNRMDAPEAALIGGTAAHALDYDDVALSSHPSAVLVPAILAEGEVLGSSGKELVAAYVAGFEVWADLFGRNKDYHRKGWHPTAVFGPIATAAAMSLLHRLDERQTAYALAIAASHAAGLVANFGTMTKPYHVGRAARDGIVATRLAANGMTGATDALEHAQGFLSAISPGPEPDRSRPRDLGEDWQILRSGLSVKRYPTCYATHRSIDAMIELANQYDLAASDIATIEVSMGLCQVAPLRVARPMTGLEAKFSEEFAMACAVVHRQVGLEEVSDRAAADPVLRGLFEKVSTITTDAQDEEDPAFSPTEDVVVTLVDGRSLSLRGIRYAKGHARNRLSADELRGKFADCVARAGAAGSSDRLYSALSDLQALRSVAEIPTIASSKFG